jgi:chromosome segregation ATPase
MASNDAVRQDGAAAARPPEWDRLELGVRRLLDEHLSWQRRARQAEARLAELEATLASVADGLDPVELSAEVARLDALNRELLERLDQARSHVNSILTRLQLLEEDR